MRNSKLKEQNIMYIENVTVNNVGCEKHYEFGKNWSRFLKVLDEQRIITAEDSLKEFLALDDLSDMRFLDVGCGSGLFSLCARRMGAEVFSFDYDNDSVNCAKELKQRFFPTYDNWNIEQGDILDMKYMSSLRDYDIVYAWGSPHRKHAP